MKQRSVSGLARFSFCGAALFLAHCGAQPLTLSPTTQQSARVRFTPAPASWMDADAGKQDLLYVSNVNGTVTVYRYDDRSRVGKLTGFSRPKGACVDRNGDVYITDRVAEDIVEYQHGGTKPVAVLLDSGFQDYACSVDPSTGNLAVANPYQADGNAGGIAIYRHARGRPTLYRIGHEPNPQACAYDDLGDLLIASDYRRAGQQVVSLVYLPRRSSTFIHLNLYVSGSQREGVYNVQWDGKYWALLYNDNIVRFQIEHDGRATYKGMTYLGGNDEGESRFWIVRLKDGSRGRGTQIVAAQPTEVLYWNYPSGGNTIGLIWKGLDEPYGVTVSLARR